MDDSHQSPFVSDFCQIYFRVSIVYSIRFIDRINDPLFDRTDDPLTLRPANNPRLLTILITSYYQQKPRDFGDNWEFQPKKVRPTQVLCAIIAHHVDSMYSYHRKFLMATSWICWWMSGWFYHHLPSWKNLEAILFKFYGNITVSCHKPVPYHNSARLHFAASHGR